MTELYITIVLIVALAIYGLIAIGKQDFNMRIPYSIEIINEAVAMYNHKCESNYADSKCCYILDAARVFGDGDIDKGINVIVEVSERLKHARNKHPWPRDAKNGEKAAIALIEEGHEALKAARREGELRTREEFIDAATVAVRGINREWEDGTAQR